MNEPAREPTALVPLEAPPVSMIRPLATADAILENWQAFVELKRTILDVTDYQDVAGRKFIKKSGWRRIAAAFGISDEIVHEERRELDGVGFVWEVTARAIAPNGRYAEGMGSCSSSERKFAHVQHDVRAMAHTRAKNRAISDLVGGGDVSAEEMDGETHSARAQVIDVAPLTTTARPFSFGGGTTAVRWQAFLDLAKKRLELSPDEIKAACRGDVKAYLAMRKKDGNYPFESLFTDLADVVNGDRPCLPGLTPLEPTLGDRIEAHAAATDAEPEAF